MAERPLLDVIRDLRWSAEAAIAGADGLAAPVDPRDGLRVLDLAERAADGFDVAARALFAHYLAANRWSLDPPTWEAWPEFQDVCREDARVAVVAYLRVRDEEGDVLREALLRLANKLEEQP